MYQNFSNPRGLCLIINNRKFKTLPARTGTDCDAENLRQLFTELGYRVTVKSDRSAAVSVLGIFVYLQFACVGLSDG